MRYSARSAERSWVAFQYVEFFWATATSIGVCGLPPMSGWMCRIHCWWYSTDVDVDPRQRGVDADRIGAVPQDVGNAEGGGFRLLLDLLHLRERQRSARDRLLVESPSHVEPGGEVEERVHRARIVDVVRRDERRVHGARLGRVDEVPDEAVRLRVRRKDASEPEVLCPNRAGEIAELRVLRIDGRKERVMADVAERARHADTVRADQRACRSRTPGRYRTGALLRFHVSRAA